ncbi:MAG: sugar transferase [Fulvivirga sp.]
MAYFYIKRALDFLIAIVLLVVLLPLFLLTAVIINYDIDRNVIFKQLRVGLNRKTFSIYKFRTMKDLYDDDGNLLPDHKRLTKTGGLIRKFSLDELPQLINILKGEMSFVGPRPLLVQYLNYYTQEEQLRHDVLPGITGWAQINGRNSISWDEKLNLDIYYVHNKSFWLDFKILLLTIWKVLKGKDINAQEDITMPMLSEIRKDRKND